MAQEGGASKILPFIIGIAICWLIFNPPAVIRSIGIAGYLIVIAVVLFAIIGLCFVAVLKNLPEDIQMRPAAQSALPPEMNRLSQELLSLGFTAASNEPLHVELSPPALLLPFVHEGEKIYSTIFKSEGAPAKISFDFFSYFDGDKGSLTTSGNWQSGVLSGSTNALKQNFIGLPLSAIFEKHKQALMYLKGKGISPRNVSRHSFYSDFRSAFQNMRKSFISSPLSSTVTAIVRTMTKKTPYIGAIQTQPEAQKQIRKMLGASLIA